MKKLLSIVLTVAMIATMACSMVSFSASAAGATSLLPANATDFTCKDGGDGSISVAKEGTGYKFTASAPGTWPQAYYMGEESTWAKAYVNDPDCYLRWDFEVKSGGANVLVFYCGQNPADQAGDGVAETINYFINPANNKNSSGAVIDLPVGHYTGKKHVSEIGCGEGFMVGEGAEKYFTVSGIKVFAVGGEVIVNDLSVGPKPDEGNNGGETPDNGGGNTGDNTQPTDTPTEPTTAPTKTEVTNKDGVVFTLSVNKAEYTEDETVEAVLRMTNKGLVELSNVNVEVPVPQGYELAEDTFNKGSKETLAKGATAELIVKLKPVAKQDTPSTTDTTAAPTDPSTTPTDPTTAPTAPTTASTAPTAAPTAPTAAPTAPTAAPTAPTAAPTAPTAAPTAAPTTPDVPKDIPKTGDTSNALLAIVIAAGAVAVVFVSMKTRGGKQMLSIALCLTLCLGTVAAVAPTWQADAEEQGSAYAETEFTVGGTTVKLTATATYDMPDKTWDEESVKWAYCDADFILEQYEQMRKYQEQFLRFPMGTPGQSSADQIVSCVELMLVYAKYVRDKTLYKEPLQLSKYLDEYTNETVYDLANQLCEELTTLLENPRPVSPTGLLDDGELKRFMDEVAVYTGKAADLYEAMLHTQNHFKMMLLFQYGWSVSDVDAL